MDLVVGASGDVGGRVAERLITRGHRVRAASRDPEGKLEALRRSGAETVRIDVHDPASVAAATHGARRVIVSIQGLIPPDRRNHPESVDLAGTRRIVEAARAAGVEHLVLVSIGGAGPDAPPRFYRLKHEVEVVVRESGIPATIARISGPLIEFHCLELLGRPLRAGKAVQFFGAGTTPLRWIAADDAADHIVEVIEDPAAVGAAVTIGGRDIMSRTEALDVVERVTDRSGTRRHMPVPAIRTMRAVTRRLHLGLHYLMDLGLAENTHPDFVGWTQPEEQLDRMGDTTVEQVVKRWAAQPEEQVVAGSPTD